MTRKYAGTEVNVDFFPKQSGVAVDPTAVTFEYRTPGWGVKTVTPTKITTGQYRATFTPEYAGMLFYRFEGTGSPTVSIEGSFLVERSAFEFARTTDYCGCR